MVLELEECVFACVCRANTPEERKKVARIGFPPGPCLGQDEMNRAGCGEGWREGWG